MTATFHPSRDFQRVRRTAPELSVLPAASPNYAARRVLVLAVAVAVLASAAVAVTQAAGALSDLGGRPAAASEVSAARAGAPAVHVAAAGDTLWSIADDYRGDIGRDRYVDALISANGGTAVQVGQAVRLP